MDSTIENIFSSNLPEGVLAASPTPFTKELKVDIRSLIAHCQWLLDNGNEGICLMGTTGEANSLSIRERMLVLQQVIEAGIPPQKLLVGTGTCAFPDTVELTKHAVSQGVGGVLVLPPFYYKNIPNEGLQTLFKILVEGVHDQNLRIYLYHFPQMTGVPYSSELIQMLVSEYPGVVVGMKDSSGDLDNVKKICEDVPGFRVYAGTERYLSDTLNAGGAGCISATTNATGNLAAKVYSEWCNGKNPIDDQTRLTAARSAFECVPFLPGLKHMFSKWHNNDDWLNVRPPNVQLNRVQRTLLEQSLNNIDFNLDNLQPDSYSQIVSN